MSTYVMILSFLMASFLIMRDYQAEPGRTNGRHVKFNSYGSLIWTFHSWFMTSILMATSILVETIFASANPSTEATTPSASVVSLAFPSFWE